MGGARPPPFITFTITSKVAVYAPAEWADTLTLFNLYKKYVLCGFNHLDVFSLTINETASPFNVRSLFYLSIISSFPSLCNYFFM